MNYLDQPRYHKEGNIFILYKANFITDESGFSESTSVTGGNTLEVGRFSSIEDLQRRSNELFGEDAKEI